MNAFSKFLITSLVGVSLMIPAQSQEQEDLIYKPFQVTVFPPIGTNGVESKDCVNTVSWNILWGVNAGLRGIEYGGIANIETDFVKGVQYAGFGNFNRGSLNGVSAAGFINTAAEVKGVQAAGFMNITDQLIGGQFAGFMNIADFVKGAQLSDFMNITDDIQGVQASGFMNIADNVNGAQVSNFMNIAENVKGVQVGFINIADNYESGVPIGFINIVKNGYHEWEISRSELLNLNVGYRMGVDRLYTQFMIGANWKNGHDFWGMGFGVGSRFGITHYLKGSVDLIFYQLMDQANYSHHWRPTMLEQVRLTVDGKILHHLRWYIGPTLNMMIAPYYYPENYLNDHLSPWVFYHNTSGVSSVQMWSGISGGIRF